VESDYISEEMGNGTGSSRLETSARAKIRFRVVIVISGEVIGIEGLRRSVKMEWSLRDRRGKQREIIGRIGETEEKTKGGRMLWRGRSHPKLT